MRMPYDKSNGGANWGYAHPAWYASKGYVVVVQDVRGRFSSEGEFTPFVHEAEDGYETVEWAARLAGANGRVGMYGFSYPGATQLLAAAARPPSLAAIAPGFTSPQFYDGWTYFGGALSLASVAGWASFLAVESARRRGDEAAHAGLLGALGGAPALYWKLPLRDYLLAARLDAPYFREWLEHSSYDDYWRATAVDEDFSRIGVPALHTGGWYDIFHAGTVATFRGIAGSAPEAADGSVAALPVARDHRRAAQGSRGERGRRLAPPLLRRGAQGRADRGLRRARPRVRAGRGLARRRRLAAAGGGRDRVPPPLGGPGELRVRRRNALARASGRRARRRLSLRSADAEPESRRPLVLLGGDRADGPGRPGAVRGIEGRPRLHALPRSSATSSCSATRVSTCTRRRPRSTPTSPPASASSTPTDARRT